MDRHRAGVQPHLGDEVARPRQDGQSDDAGDTSEHPAAMNACAIPEAACGPAMAPLPAAIVEKIATPTVPPIS